MALPGGRLSITPRLSSRRSPSDSSIEAMHEINAARGRRLSRSCYFFVCTFSCSLLLVATAFALFRLSVDVQCRAVCPHDWYDEIPVLCAHAEPSNASEASDGRLPPTNASLGTRGEESEASLSSRWRQASSARQARGAATTISARHIAAMQRQGNGEEHGEPRAAAAAEPLSADERQELAAEARALVEGSSGFGVLSTITSDDGVTSGYPRGSIVGFGLTGSGHPIFSLTSLSGHHGDLVHPHENSPKGSGPEGAVGASLTVQAANFGTVADGRVTLTGRVVRVSEEAAQELRARYLEKHEGAFWVDFGDFEWFQMSEIGRISYVGGFGRAGDVDPDEYMLSLMN